MTKKIGIDLGRSSIKYFSEKGGASIPAYLGHGKPKLLLGHSDSLTIIEYSGRHYTIGEDAYLGGGFSWKGDEVKSDESSLIFTMAVMNKLDIYDADIAVGLPVGTFEAEKDRIKYILSGEKKAIVNGTERTFKINTSVLSEPLGTYLSLILDDNGRPIDLSPYYKRLIGVVDIGYRTVDVVIIKEGKMAKAMESSLMGTINVFTRIRKDLEAAHGMLKSNETVELYNALTTNYNVSPLWIGRKCLDQNFWKKCDTYKAELARDIVDFVKATMSDISPVILYTGGGAIFLERDIRELLPATIHPNPRYANAIGFYKSLFL